MGQSQPQSPTTQPPQPSLPFKQPSRPKHSPSPSFQEHEGILKLRKVPFRNSVQISEHPSLFLENIPDTLADVLELRYNTNKYFSEYEIQQFVEAVLYTLSFLETKGITYSDLSTENIHYDEENGTYKLLPMELIKQGIYEQALKSKHFGLLSPELILGLRYKEKEIEEEIMNKSNVFTFGMILLELTTLQPSIECYDTKHNQILDDVITQRLQKVQEIYQPQIEKLIQIMIEYDYTKRMNLQDLSILVNKTLAQNTVSNSSTIKRNKSFSRFRNIDESLSHEKSYQKTGVDKRYERPERDVVRESVSRIHEKSIGVKNISPSRLKANTVLPVNYHQTPKRQSLQYPGTQFSQEMPVLQQQQLPQFVQRQKSSRRVQYDQEPEHYQEPEQEDEYYYQPQQYTMKPQVQPSSYVGYPPPMYTQAPNYSRIMYCPTSQSQPVYQPPPQYTQQYAQYPPPSQHQYQQYSQHYQYQPQSQIQQQYYDNPFTSKNHIPKASTTTIYPPAQKLQQTPNLNNNHTYYEQQNQVYDYTPPPRPASSAYYNQYPSPSMHQPRPSYQQPVSSSKHNPYINYQQPPSKELSFEQQYQDSFAKNPSYSSPHNVLKSHNYTPMPPHRDSSSYILKQNNAQRYDRKSTELSDLSDSSIVKIKEEIAKSRELIMELQKHDSGHRR